MQKAIVYSSRTGNTEMLAQTVRQVLAQVEYFGRPDPVALAADRLYVGFYTDKGTCDPALADFLADLRGKEIFLFGTAGFGGSPDYFEEILCRVKAHIDPSNTLIGTFMCQGKMPATVRERYERLRSSPVPVHNLENMIANFDKALSHPDADDRMRLEQLVCEVEGNILQSKES